MPERLKELMDADMARVWTLTGTALGITLADVQLILSIAALAVTIIYTMMKIMRMPRKEKEQPNE